MYCGLNVEISYPNGMLNVLDFIMFYCIALQKIKRQRMCYILLFIHLLKHLWEPTKCYIFGDFFPFGSELKSQYNNSRFGFCGYRAHTLLGEKG